MAERRPGPPSATQCSQFPPLGAPSAPQCSQFPPPSLGALIPPSHFVLRPSPPHRSLGAELAVERGRGHELEVELKSLRGQSQALKAELEAEKGRSQSLEAELEAEKGRSQSLEAELEAEKGRGQSLETELEAEKGRSRSLEAELEAEKGRSQSLEAELEAEKGRSQSLEAELEAERKQHQVLEGELEVLRGRGQRLEEELEAERAQSQILEMELKALRGRGHNPEGAEPSPEQVLLSRWRQKVFQLLLQVRLHQGQELRLQGQALSQERLRAEAAEEELGKLGQALRRLLGTLGMALANVTAAVGALETLSERLGRARHRLWALVASGRLQRQRQLEGTAGDSGTVAPEVTPEVTTAQLKGWHRGDSGDTGGGSVPKVPPLCPPKGRDRTQPLPGRGPCTVPSVSLAPWVTQLQALGAAILGDIGDPVVPPPLRGQW
ncbi:coiled-coil domain-containing protein 88B-like isoform X4 [Prinia subflava]|uniref:coiled-coil domain-containing protein 88B-like isoform X4 n=1 Tax=Prinia subflava TaxID=208062 RepID=UPI002FE3CD1C